MRNRSLIRPIRFCPGPESLLAPGAKNCRLLAHKYKGEKKRDRSHHVCRGKLGSSSHPHPRDWRNPTTGIPFCCQLAGNADVSANIPGTSQSIPASAACAAGAQPGRPFCCIPKGLDPCTVSCFSFPHSNPHLALLVMLAIPFSSPSSTFGSSTTYPLCPAWGLAPISI